MKLAIHTALLITVGLALAPAVVRAEDSSELKDTKEKISYSIGMNIGMSLKRGGYDVDVDVLSGAIRDMLAGKPTKLTEAQAREVMQSYQKEMMAKRDEGRKALADKNKNAGEAFLAENKTKPGIQTKSVTLPDGRTVEYQYKVIAEGSGPSPKPDDTVSVNYKGTLLNGTEFDSSAKHGGKPAQFKLNGVIKGWTEAVQLMKPGAKYQVFLPAALAYGDFGSGPMIEPGAALIFDIELVSIDTPQPLTSDIIKVPSAEELKKGAKIEVIKAEDVDKQTKAAQSPDKK